MKHYIVTLDADGNTIHQRAPLTEHSKAMKRCGRLNAELEKNPKPGVAGYEIVSED